MTKAGKTVEGTVNRLIDALMHPYFEDHPALIVVDGLLHAFFEQDPEITLMHAWLFRKRRKDLLLPFAALMSHE